MDQVFKALGDASRRHILDKLFKSNGLTLNELCKGYKMSRQAVSKHLRILEDANLVTTRKEGRNKRHFLNPVPIHEIYMRWIGKFEKGHLDALFNLKQSLTKETTHEK